MSDIQGDLNALIGSRLCHDLISPIGAIANGMELLEMTMPPSPETDLIRQSVNNVNARIKFFRIGFGLASPEQQTGIGEIAPIVQNFFSSDRLNVRWHPQVDIARAEAKAAFLALLCLEEALPVGGTIDVERDEEGQWQIVAEGPKLRVIQQGWDHLNSGGAIPSGAAHVHFPLLHQWGVTYQRPITGTLSDTRAEIQF